MSVLAKVLVFSHESAMCQTQSNDHPKQTCKHDCVDTLLIYFTYLREYYEIYFFWEFFMRRYFSFYAFVCSPFASITEILLSIFHIIHVDFRKLKDIFLNFKNYWMKWKLWEFVFNAKRCFQNFLESHSHQNIKHELIKWSQFNQHFVNRKHSNNHMLKILQELQMGELQNLCKV